MSDPPPPYDPNTNGLHTYELACQLAREGNAGVRSWFSRPVRAGADDYAAFLAGKAPAALAVGLRDIPCLSSHLFPIQRSVTEFTLRTGRAGVYLGTGLGKSVIQLEHSQHAAAATNGKALILAPLAVAMQFKREGDKHGYAVRVIRERSDVGDGINICNYDRIDKIDPDDFGSVCLDEASVLKDFSGKTTRALTDAFAAHRFRVVATATPAPNDHMELGTQSEFLGVLDYREMLSRWFVNDTATASQKWRLKGHAVSAFWDWVASWSRMATMPSDMGFPDAGYILPPLRVIRHKAKTAPLKPRSGELFATQASATTIFDAKRQTTADRADVVAGLVHAEPSEPWVCWADTNDEADALMQRIPDAIEVRGNMRTEAKEEAIAAFLDGQARVLVTKASICGWGLNFQRCARTAFVGRTFSYEAWHQAVRRFHRFGQTREVHVHVVVADSEQYADAAIQRKEADHTRMRAEMVAAMRRDRSRASSRMVGYDPKHKGALPAWLSA